MVDRTSLQTIIYDAILIALTRRGFLYLALPITPCELTFLSLETSCKPLRRREVLNRLQDPEMKAEVLWCKIDRNRLPRGFSYLIIGVVYHPPSADDNYMNNYLLNCLSFIESEFPNAAILIVGDFNRLDISQLETQFNLKAKFEKV